MLTVLQCIYCSALDCTVLHGTTRFIVQLVALISKLFLFSGLRLFLCYAIKSPPPFIMKKTVKLSKKMILIFHLDALNAMQKTLALNTERYLKKSRKNLQK